MLQYYIIKKIDSNESLIEMELKVSLKVESVENK